MAFDRFLLTHNVPQRRESLMWLWLALGLGLSWLLRRARRARLPDPCAVVAGLFRAALALLLFMIMAPVAGFLSGGGGVMVRRNDWPGQDA